MKIMHVSKKYPPALGGDATVVAQLQKEQQAAGHKVVIVTSQCDEISRSHDIYLCGLKTTSSKLDEITPKRLVSLIMLAFRMFKILRKEQPNIIHTHSIDMAFFVSWAARLYRIPIVHTFHIVTFYDNNQSPLRRKTELWFAKHAKLRITTAPNAYDVEQLQKAGLKQTMLLPNGVDIGFWAAKKPRTARNKRFTFVTMGRLEDQKGGHYLIKAAYALQYIASAPFTVIVVGEGSLENELRAQVAELELTHSFEFVGRKNPEEIRKLLARADTVVLPSLYETTPLTLLEAWAARVPVIITEVGIVRRVSDDFNAAYIVPPKDDQLLAQAMNRCMTDAARRSAVAAAGQKEAHRYAWPAIADIAESLYKGTQ
jgi:glycosyltransferase involved in cell wall biosynthesis